MKTINFEKLKEIACENKVNVFLTEIIETATDKRIEAIGVKGVYGNKNYILNYGDHFKGLASDYYGHQKIDPVLVAKQILAYA